MMKENYTTSPPAVYVQQSQPVGASYNPNPVYTATGYPASTDPYASQNNYNNYGTGSGGVVGVNNPRPPQGRWRDDLCECSKNCFPSCYCVCCCCWGYYLMAQSKAFFLMLCFLNFFTVAEKTACMSFRNAIWIGLIIWLICLILEIIFPAVSVLGWVTLIVAIIFGINLRLHVVRQENIASNTCSDICIGLWCHCCSVAQSTCLCLLFHFQLTSSLLVFSRKASVWLYESFRW
jgi:hypothetical protein